MSEVVEKKQPKTTKEKVFFGLKIAGNVLFYAVIVCLFLFSIMNINSGGKGGIPNLFGKGFLSVQTESMERSKEVEDLPEWKDYKIKNINKGDLITVNIFKGKTVKKLKVGDVITFYDSKLEGLNTHRIVYINEEENYVIAQGDKVAEYTPFDKQNPFSEENGKLEIYGDTQHVSVSDIKAVVTGVSRGTGKALDFVHKDQNWLFIFVIPVLALLLFEVFMVVKNIMDLKGEKQKVALASDKEAMMAEIEAEKEKMRQELLAELRAAQQAQPKEETKVEEVQEVVEEPVQEESQTEETVEPQEEETTETLEEVTEEEVKTE